MLKLDREGRIYGSNAILLILLGALKSVFQVEFLYFISGGLFIFLGVLYLTIAYLPVIIVRSQQRSE